MDLASSRHFTPTPFTPVAKHPHTFTPPPPQGLTINCMKEDFTEKK